MSRRDNRPKEYNLSTLLLFHDRLATSVLLFMLAVGIWGIVSFARGGVLTGSVSGALVIGQALVVAQVVAGVALYLNGSRPESSVHILYGVTAIIVLPFVWTYVKDRHPRQGLLIYSLVALFIAGLSIRGMATGS
ncbi:MAG: hypothetical protein ACRDJH_16370 [Thermomicrobiales bacterium]